MTFADIDLYVDGNLIDLSEVEGLGDFSITLREQTEDGDSGVSFSSDIEFFGAAFEILKTKIIDADSPHLNEIPVEIVSKCCLDGEKRRVLFTGKIVGDSVAWCEVSADDTCRASTAFVDDSQDSKTLDCLKNTIIWGKKEKADGSGLTEGEDAFRKCPRIVYGNVVTPRFWAKILLGIFWLVFKAVIPILTFVGKMADRFNDMIEKINSLLPPFAGNIPLIDLDGNSATSNAQTVKDKLTELAKGFLGLNYRHKAPFIHSYLENLCQSCGLTLSSDVFGVGAPYHNLMRLDCQKSEGATDFLSVGGFTLTIGNLEAAWEKNKPNLNGLQFLDGLRKDLNLKWWIDGNVLNVHFDHDKTQVWFDMEGNESEVLELCYEITKERPKKNGFFEYTQDGIDSHGDEARSWWSRVFEFGNPAKPPQSGLLHKTLPYGAARFRKDARATFKLPIDEAEFIDEIEGASEFANCLILKDGTAAYPKLLLWDAQSPTADALVWRKQITDDFDYNVPMWMVKTYDQDAAQLTGYQSFFKNEDPTSGDFRGRTYTLRLPMTCKRLSEVSLKKMIRIKRNNTYIKASTEEVTLNFESGEIIVKGRA